MKREIGNSIISKRNPLLYLTAYLMLAISVCGCSAAYQRAENGGLGYSDTQITQHIFKITYRGGFSLDSSQVENFALYRAAELMKSLGFERFRVLRAKTTAHVAGSGSFAVTANQRREGSGHFETVSHLPSDQTCYFAELTVEAMRGQSSDATSEIYKVAEVLQYLHAKVEIGKPKRESTVKKGQR